MKDPSLLNSKVRKIVITSTFDYCVPKSLWPSFQSFCIFFTKPHTTVTTARFHREHFQWKVEWIVVMDLKFSALGFYDSKPGVLSLALSFSQVCDLSFVGTKFPVVLSGWKQPTMFHMQQSLMVEYPWEGFHVTIKIITKLIRHAFNDMYNSYSATHH